MLDATGFDKPFQEISQIDNAPFTAELRALEALCSSRRQLELLSLQEIQHLLDRLNKLQSEVVELEASSAEKPLLAAIFRLSADLSEHLMARLMDSYNDKQHSIDFLQQELSRKLRDQNTTSRLLRQTQALRVQTQHYGETLALGHML
ncbi:MAG: hypothetical protein VKJ04_08165 [Vampirovibrionales bacterium]|nr:hypothetical protein [Vampirovibrionales bacterium]